MHAAGGSCRLICVVGESGRLGVGVQAAIKAAEMYYIAGFVLTHSADSIMHVCKHSHDNGKVSSNPPRAFPALCVRSS